MNSSPIRQIIFPLSKYYANAKETEKIITDCAQAAARVNTVVSFIPVLSVPATIVSCFSAVLAMYGKLCRKLGISLKPNVRKLLARTAISNVAANLDIVFFGLITILCYPVPSISMSATVIFSTLYIAGYNFLQTVLSLAEKSCDPHSFSDISEDEIKRIIKRVGVRSKDDLNAAMAAYYSRK